MNLLAQSQAFLEMALLNDPLHQLACLTVLLDPLWIGISDADELDPNEQDYYEGNDPIQQALLVSRECFPEIYVEAVSALHRGVSRHDLDSLLCKGFGEAGIPMENLELVWYGIPLPAYGSQLSEPDFHSQFPQAEAVLQCFGVDLEAGEIPPEASDLAIMLVHRLRQMKEPICQQISWVLAWLWGVSGNSSILCGIEMEKSRSRINIFENRFQSDKVYTIGEIIANSLEQQEAEPYQQFSWTVKWLFSCSNNSCVDWDTETMDSVEPLAWIAEDVAFAVELIAEAEAIMADVEAGLAWVKGEVGVLLALWYNARQIDQMLANNVESHAEVSLSWPDLSQDAVTQVKTLVEEWGYPAVQSE